MIGTTLLVMSIGERLAQAHVIVGIILIVLGIVFYILSNRFSEVSHKDEEINSKSPSVIKWRIFGLLLFIIGLILNCFP